MSANKGFCKTKEPVVLSFRTFNGGNCYLHYGYNAKFEFEIKGSVAYLYKPNTDIEIPVADFERMFTIIVTN